ncbi:SAF domain-containing protein [soil metagenome]
MQQNNKQIRVGIVGTGCIGRGLARVISKRKDMTVAGLLTRRKGKIEDLAVSQELVTLIPEILFEKSDLIVVSTGDPLYSTDIIDLAFTYDLPVVTMDADTQVVSGSWLSQRGFITESEGDQPGCLAALKEEVELMGFKPIVYGNIKGFLNQNPSLEDMTFWAKKQGFSLNSVTSFTDGTKLQIEQCLVANGFGAEIARQGLIGERVTELENGAMALANEAGSLGKVLSDYIISRESPPGVFIAATHHEDLSSGLKTYKMGDGPYYLLYRPIHLCYFEIPKTIHRAYYSQNVLLSNGTRPKISVGAVAKDKISRGTHISKGIGSMELRGEAIELKENPIHIPIGLMDNVVFTNNIEPGQVITFDDVDVPESKALKAWLSSIKIIDRATIEYKI